MMTLAVSSIPFNLICTLQFLIELPCICFLKFEFLLKYLLTNIQLLGLPEQVSRGFSVHKMNDKNWCCFGVFPQMCMAVWNDIAVNGNISRLKEVE